MRLVTVLIFLALASTTSAQWLPEEAFPEGGHLTAFVFSGDTILAGGDRLFSSTNAGRSWHEILSVPTYVRVRRFERLGNAIFALCDTALWRSTDAGVSWSMMLGWRGDGLAQLAADPAGRLFVATVRWVKVSTDNGVSWRRTSRTPLLLNPPDALVYVAGRLHVGEVNGHQFTTDDGETWRASPPVDNRRVAPMAFAAAPDGVLHAGTAYGYYYSLDSGSTWARRSSGDSLDQRVIALAVERDTIWTAHRGFVMRSTDHGTTWSYLSGSPQPTIGQLVWRRDTLWAATERSGFAFSIDGGQRWTGMNRGMPGQFDDNGVFRDVDAFYDFGAFALLTTPVGILRTSDSGRTWAKHDSLAGAGDRRLGGDVFDIVRHADTLYCIDQRGFYFSSDEGRSWSASALSGAGTGHFYRALEVLGDTLVASGGLLGIVRFVRRDGGWRQIDSTIGVDGNALLARGDTLFCGGSNGVWRSVDRGDHWQRQTEGLADGLAIETIIVTPSGTVYAYSEEAGLPLLWMSSDGGERWESIDVPEQLDAALPEGAFATVGETLFIGLNDRVGSTRGVYRSSDRGATWERVSTGRLSDANVLALGRHGDQLLAWTRSYGIWRRSTSELVASSPLDDQPARRLRLIPNPTSGSVRVECTGHAMLSVVDVLGRMALSTSDAGIDAGSLDDGLYLVVARDRQGRIVGSAPLVVRR